MKTGYLRGRIFRRLLSLPVIAMKPSLEIRPRVLLFWHDTAVMAPLDVPVRNTGTIASPGTIEETGTIAETGTATETGTIAEAATTPETGATAENGAIAETGITPHTGTTGCSHSMPSEAISQAQ